MTIFKRTSHGPGRHFSHGRKVVAALSLATLAGTVSAETGFAPQTLATQIDSQIAEILQEGNIVGMTVAATQGGRLVYSKGFGRSRRAEDAGGGIDVMLPTDRTRIGSNSKALMSGPGLFKAMEAEGMDPISTRVYGHDGVLGEQYEAYQRVSTDRHRPILATAIASDDRVYTWYVNGKVSIGTSSNLTAYQAPVRFRVADGMQLRDLHAVAISPADVVYAWYKDGSLSIGNSRDLDAYQGIPRNDKGEPTSTVSMPIGSDGDRKSMHDVIGVGIAKSNSHVYAFFDDGTVSSGTSLDFDRYFSNRSFVSPNINHADYRYRIRGMGIAADDTIYSWASGKLAFAGHSRNLSAYRAPYAYSHAFDKPKPNRYLDITVQHLFDHTSGFFGSGDEEATQRLFPYQGTPDYDHIHRHFLATRPLKWAPGTDYSYSNHGMGLTTLLIEAVTGRTYRDYVVNSYLRPMGLKGKVRAQKAVPDQFDAYPYVLSSGEPVELEFKASTTGLAAGGWTSSAQGMLAVTTNQADTFGYEVMDQFGFYGSSRGKLSHNGDTGGGYSTIAVFPAGYTAVSGQDLSDVHVALATNTSNLTDETKSRITAMASEIAKAVADAGLPASVDYWNVAWN